MTHERPGPPDEEGQADIEPPRLTVFGAERLVRAMENPGFILVPAGSVVDLSVVQTGERQGRDVFLDLPAIQLHKSSEWRAVGTEMSLKGREHFALAVPDSETRRKENRALKKHLRDLRTSMTPITPQEKNTSLALRATVDAIDVRLARRALTTLIDPAIVHEIDTSRVTSLVARIRTNEQPHFKNIRGV